MQKLWIANLGLSKLVVLNAKEVVQDAIQNGMVKADHKRDAQMLK